MCCHVDAQMPLWQTCLTCGAAGFERVIITDKRLKDPLGSHRVDGVTDRPLHSQCSRRTCYALVQGVTLPLNG